MQEKPKLLFMGTPEIAATVLGYLYHAGCHICGVITREDKPRGRHGVLTPPPVKVFAEEKGLPVLQPKNLRAPELMPFLEAAAPDIIVVVAYGRILPPEVLHYPKYGCINLHVSLLPRYRGAAPMQRAVMNGDTETGITTMLMDEGLDTGDILQTERFPIKKEDTFETVHDTSAALGGPLLLRTIEAWTGGRLTPTPQESEGVSYAEKIETRDTFLDFSQPADALHAKIRGLYPFPLARTMLPDGRLLKIASAEVCEGCGTPGEIIEASDRGDGCVAVACGDKALRLLTVQPEGKPKMPAADLVRGRKLALGDRLSTPKE